jgi:toxin CcdB
MPRQFDVYRRANGTLVVILQHDLMDALATRVVAPLVPTRQKGNGIKGVNPIVYIGDTDFVLALEFPAAATERELGTYVANIAHVRDDIIRALDLLFTGV